MTTFDVEGHKFIVKDIYPRKITMADSFLIGSNKIGTGNGEAKLYLGSKFKTRAYFGGEGFSAECFLLKSDLIRFLDYIENEYHDPKFKHRANRAKLRKLGEERRRIINDLDEIIPFTIYDKCNLKGDRGYVISKDDAFEIIRKIPLPLMSYLSIMRVIEAKTNKHKYYWKLFVDYDYLDSKVDATVFKYGKRKNKGKRGRPGQAKYRSLLLEECSSCPITHISNKDLLIAGHIKPFADSSDKEKIDPKNGFILSLIYDKLFGLGYITFSDDKRMIVSKWLPSEDQDLLKLNEINYVEDLPLDEERKKYLRYHREHKFKN